jgi:putative ABC transport system permease protein
MIHYAIIGVLVLGMATIVATLLSSDKGRRGLLLAVRSLWLHKLRAALSVTGIIIGTGAVIALMGFAEGSMQDTLNAIARQGATNIIIRSNKPPDDSSTQRRTFLAVYGLTYADYERLQMIDGVTKHVPMRIFPTEVRYLERMQNGKLVATTPGYADINDVKMAAGRFLTEADNFNMLNVAVLGSEIAEKLFPFEDPLHQYVRLGNYFYQVVGVITDRMPLSAVGGTTSSAEDFNNDVYIPLKTCLVRFGEKVFIRESGSRRGEQVELSQVTLTVKDMDTVRPVGAVVDDLLKPPYHAKSDYAVTIPLDKLQQAEEAQKLFTGLMAMIGGISLLVGGIGIMNIMLATVTERTREIGIRRALGAKRRDIVLQFLIEAVVQTAIGGLIGVLLGLTVVLVGPTLASFLFDKKAPALIYGPSIVYSLAVSLGVGVLFGLYPAWRASRLDPIEALRHE